MTLQNYAALRRQVEYNHGTYPMGASLNQILSVLTEPAGSLIYHLILVFSIAGALQSAFVHWRSSEFPQARRTMFGLGVLLVAQIALFLARRQAGTRTAT